MSLRTRVVALIGVVLLVSLLLGTLMAGYQVKLALRTELNAALIGGEQTVRSAFEDLPRSDHPARDLHQLVSTFDGNRHIEAVLTDSGGKPVQQSHTRAGGGSAPAWFTALLGKSPPGRALQIPKGVVGFSAVRLDPTPAIDAGAAWEEFLRVVSVLVLSFAAGLILVHLAIGAALRPLAALAAAFAHIGQGDFSGRVDEGGPTDLVSLQQGFNAMAEHLAAATARNRQLTDQLLSIQDEERADIARDLHDEIGPHLFSVSMDAELIAQLNEAGRREAVAERVTSMQAAVAHMQRQVRDLLGRLRPARQTEFGLKPALQELARFWTARRPEIHFHLDLAHEDAAPETLPEALKEAAYRIVQEATNNAVRHGNPKSVAIVVAIQNETALLITVFDDGTPHQPAGANGFGLIGMRERAAALGGALSAGPVAEGGWRVTARLPLPRAALAPSAPELVG